jgi:hypothetical protein
MQFLSILAWLCERRGMPSKARPTNDLRCPHESIAAGFLFHCSQNPIIAARLQVKGGSFRDLPLTKELSDSLEEWFAFLESVKGVRLRTGAIDFAGVQLAAPGRVQSARGRGDHRPWTAAFGRYDSA